MAGEISDAGSLERELREAAIKARITSTNPNRYLSTALMMASLND